MVNSPCLHMGITFKEFEGIIVKARKAPFNSIEFRILPTSANSEQVNTSKNATPRLPRYPSSAAISTSLAMPSAIKKVNMIARIVRLRQFVRRWRIKSLLSRHSSDYSDGASSSRRTPSGTLAVYVGPERVRFVIPTRFLNFPVFVDLLHEAEEEFGFQSSGGLALPCDPGFFREVVRLLEEEEEAFCGLGLNEFWNVVSELHPEPLDHCKESSPSISLSPLLPNARV